MGGPHGPMTVYQVQRDVICAPIFLQGGTDLHSVFSLEFLLNRAEEHLCHDLEVSLPPLLGVPAACSPPSPTRWPTVVLCCHLLRYKPQPVSALAGARTTVCSPSWWVENIWAKL